MAENFEKSTSNSNDYKYNESIKNAFLFKKEEVSRLMEEQLAEKTFSKEIITEAWAKLDTVYDSFVLSYNNNDIPIYEKNIVKVILDSYLMELKEIRGKLHSVIPFNGLQISKLQEEITRIEIILEWNKNKF
ncbi:hypothetical protein [Candidatus Nitrosocosmicus sp. T]